MAGTDAVKGMQKEDPTETTSLLDIFSLRR